MEQLRRGHWDQCNGDHCSAGEVEEPILYSRQAVEQEEKNADRAQHADHNVTARANIEGVIRADGIVGPIAASPHQQEGQKSGDQADPETQIKIASCSLSREHVLEVTFNFWFEVPTARGIRLKRLLNTRHHSPPTQRTGKIRQSETYAPPCIAASKTLGWRRGWDSNPRWA